MSIVPQKLVEIQKLHAAYRRLTGLVVPLDSFREYQWFEFLRRGLGEADLAAVVRGIRKGIAEGKRNRGALRFHNLIGQVDLFEEELAEAASMARKPAGRNPKAEILRATGRDSQSPIANSQRAGDVAAALASDPAKAKAALEELQRLKNSL